MATCPKCKTRLSLPAVVAERIVCPNCDAVLRTPQKEPANEPAELAPAARPGRSVPTIFLAVAHFLFALVLALVGIGAIVLFVAASRNGLPFRVGDLEVTERLMGYLIFSAIGVFVLAVVVSGVGAAVWWREKAGFFLSLALVAAVGSGLYTAFALEDDRLALLVVVSWLGVPHAGFTVFMFLFPDLWRDFWGHR